MESEKVKEIKKALEFCTSLKKRCRDCDYNEIGCYKLLKDSLTLINELESENERLKWEKQTLEDKDTLLAKVGEMVQENQQLKDRIAELEALCNKTYEDLTKEIDRLEKERGDQLKQFAERLKEKLEEYRLENEYFTEHEPNSNLWQMNSSVFCIEVTQDGGLVDETLKEFIKGVEVEE